MEALEVDQEALPLTSAFKLRWDVFLSFRGEDTRHNITSTLYKALVSRNVQVFKDNVLEEGHVIKEKLEEAITYSSSSVAIISKNYANSHWCLDELSMICEFGRPVFPVFYDVEPSDVKRQKGPYFEKDFQNLEKEHGIDKGVRWRQAMNIVGGINGFVCNAITRMRMRDISIPEVTKIDEPLIQSIVKRVLSEVVKAPIKVAPYLVGLDSHFEKLKDVLNVSPRNGPKVLMIHGIGGVGKTTLATALYNKLAQHFDHRCYILNVREHGAAVHLQNRIIKSLSTNTTLVDNEHSGILAIKRLYQEERVLLALDDVENLEQLKPLAIQLDWISESSRIIITCRNVFRFHANSDIEVKEYELSELHTSNSLRLFSYYAFRRENPTQNLLKLSVEIVNLTGGLPLALEVFGSFMFDKKENQWPDAIQKLKKSPPDKLQHILRISFESLDVEEQCVFLDVACLFLNLDIKKKDLIIVLRGCEFSGETVIATLMSRSLLKFTGNDTLMMHDLIRDMGRKIVEEKSFSSLGKRSRLWDIQDVISVLHDMKGSRETEGIILDLNSRSFSRNQRAQYIVLSQRKTTKSLLSIFTSFKEVYGKYNQNRVNEEGEHAEGELVLNTTLLKTMVNLRLLQFSKVKLEGNLHDLPSSLKWLQLKSCNLDHLALTCPEELRVLDLSGSKLWRIKWNTPKVTSKLKVMSLQSCREIVETPDFSMHHSLDTLIFEGCNSLKQVHPSITGLTCLRYLNFRDCVNFSNLPSDVSGLKQLEILILSGCTRLKELPKNIGRLTSLRELLLGETDVKILPEDIFCLTKLEKLNLDHCGKLKQLPKYIGKLLSLREMSLYSSAIEGIPDTIGSLGNLEILNLMWCKSLTVIPETIGELKLLRKLFLDGSSVRILPESIGLLHNLNVLSVGNCCGMSTLPCSIGELCNLVELQLNETPITSLPYEIRGLKSLKKLEMRDFTQLYFLPESLGDMSSLETLVMTNASITYLPKSIGKLENLITLRLTGCKNAIILSESISYVKKLQHLFLDESVERQCSLH